MRLPFTEDQGTEEEQARIAYLESLYKDADKARRAAEPDWASNIGFLTGKQWDAYEEDIRRFRKIPIKAPSSKVKLSMNETYPLARQAASALRQGEASQIAIASTNDPEDMEAAQLATKLLDSRLLADDEETKRLNTVLWAMNCGTIFRETSWDPDLEGDVVGYDTPQWGVGDISTEVVNPFTIHICPWSDCFTPAPWVIRSDVRDVGDIADIYGKKVEPEEVADLTSMLDRLLSGIVTGGQSATPKRNQAVILKRLFVRPTAKYPTGRMFVWANKVLLADTELPMGMFPFTRADWFPIPGSAYSLPMISPMRDVQRELNITISQLIELKNRQLRGDIAFDGPGDVTFTTDPATGAKTIRVPYGTTKWDFVTYDLRTTEADVLANRFMDALRQAAGIHEPTMGDAPGKAVTATQLQLLKEADMAGIGLFRAGFDKSNCAISQLKLQIAHDFYQVPRILRVVGQSEVKEVQAFMGSDLRNTRDVRPKNSPIVSETMKIQMMQEQINAGNHILEGTPTQIAAKVEAWLVSGIPNIEEMVDQWLAPLTVDDIRSASADYRKLMIQGQMLDAQLKIQQTQMMASMPPQGLQGPSQPQQGASAPGGQGIPA